MSDLNQTDQQLDWSVSIWKCYSKMFYLEFSLDLKSKDLMKSKSFIEYSQTCEQTGLKLL